MKKYLNFTNIIKFFKKVIFIIFCFLVFITCITNFYGGNHIENKVIRYIKHKKKTNLLKHYYEKEIPYIKKYVKFLREGYFQSNINYNKIFEPKISFIATVYNKEKYLISFICSIQYQNLKEFELIIVDDSSTDRSVEIIKNISKKDKRIKLIINKKNMANGAKHSKGKYIIFVDSDDIILKSGISNSKKKKNLDIIQFNSVIESKDNESYINRRYYNYSEIIFQPILSYIYYYNKKSGSEYNTALWDKLIKRQY